MSGPVTSVARVEDVQIFLKDPVYSKTFVQKFAESVVLSGQTCYKERSENDVILLFSIEIGSIFTGMIFCINGHTVIPRLTSDPANEFFG